MIIYGIKVDPATKTISEIEINAENSDTMIMDICNAIGCEEVDSTHINSDEEWSYDVVMYADVNTMKGTLPELCTVEPDGEITGIYGGTVIVLNSDKNIYKPLKCTLENVKSVIRFFDDKTIEAVLIDPEEKTFTPIELELDENQSYEKSLFKAMGEQPFMVRENEDMYIAISEKQYENAPDIIIRDENGKELFRFKDKAVVFNTYNYKYAPLRTDIEALKKIYFFQ